MNDTMIMDLDILNIHCDSVDDTLEQVGEHLGIKETPFKLDDEIERMEFMVKMLYKHSHLLKDSRWSLAQA